MHCWRGVLVHSIYASAQPIWLLVRYLRDPTYFQSVSTAWLAITILSWIYIINKATIPFFTSPLRYLPSPKGEVFPFGHLRVLAEQPPTNKITDAIINTPNDGLIVMYRFFYLRCEVLPTRPDTIMDVLNTHNYDWEKPAAAKKLLARVLGEGLINVEGNVHKSMRKAVAPAFSGRHIRDLVPLFYTKGLAFANSMAREAKNSPTGDNSLEMMHQMSRVTLDIIGAAGVGKDFNTIENDDDELAKLYATITDTKRGPLLLFFLINVMIPPAIVRHFHGTVYSRVAKAHTKLRKDVRALMREKKEKETQISLEKGEKTGEITGSGGGSNQSKDIISIIMRSGDYSEDYLTNQLLTFLAAGHDTTASALTWTTYLLSLHPKVQTRLREECKLHLSHISLPSSSPSSSSTTSSSTTVEIDASIFDPETTPYLHAVCNETLRLYPTVPATVRHSVVNSTKIGTTKIPKGTYAFLSPWAINRLPDLWGTDANEYNPERWLNSETNKNAAGVGSAGSPHALITFLHGPRSCIGQSFARTEMKCLLAALILRFRFEIADPNEEVKVGGFITIKPLNGLRLRLIDLKEEARSETQGEA